MYYLFVFLLWQSENLVHFIFHINKINNVGYFESDYKVYLLLLQSAKTNEILQGTWCTKREGMSWVVILSELIHMDVPEEEEWCRFETCSLPQSNCQVCTYKCTFYQMGLTNKPAIVEDAVPKLPPRRYTLELLCDQISVGEGQQK